MRATRVWVLVLAMVWSAVAGAQVPLLPAPQPAPPAPASQPAAEPIAEAIPTSEIPRRTESAISAARSAIDLAQKRRSTEAMGDAVELVGEELRRQAEDTRRQLDGPIQVTRLRDLRAQWIRAEQSVDARHQALAARLDELDAELRAIELRHETWQLTASQALPPELQASVEATTLRLSEALTTLEDRRSVVLRMEVESARNLTLVDGVLRDIDAAEQVQRERLLSRDSPALWNALGAGEDDGAMSEQLSGTLQANQDSLTSYLDQAWRRVLLQVLLFLGLALVLMRAHRASGDHADESAAGVLDRPISAALVVAILVDPWLHPYAPVAWSRLVGLVMLPPLLRILDRLVGRSLRPALAVLAGVYLLHRVTGLLMTGSALYRLGLLALALVAVLSALWLVGRLHPDRLKERTRFADLLRSLVRIGLVLVAVAALADVIGSVTLSALLLDGTLESVYGAVAAWAGLMVIRQGVSAGLRTPSAQSLGMVARHREAIEGRLYRVVVWVVALLWALYALSAFTVLVPLVAVLRRVLTASLGVGQLQVSMGGIVAFAVAVWVAVSLSRLLRFVLDEDVLPRLALPEGMPSTISKTTHYAVLAVGFFFALAAAGVELSHFAFLAGALGVGIGFGLQNIVNNFISGLILLFERPIQEGDMIDVGGIVGKVENIGIRACRVRALDGAEVIVPNANLISNDVVNWTLTDRLRRVQLPVSVAYGTDPARVVQLLNDVSATNDRVRRYPAPEALFLQFGDSSLNFELRAWVKFEDYHRTWSDLAVAVAAALKEAQIEIPFPQRDLHLRSVAAKAADVLGGRER